MGRRNLLIYILFSLLKFNIFLLLSNSSLENMSHFDEKVQNKVKLYLPEYQNKYIRLNELNHTNFNFTKIRNTRNTVLISDDILETYDDVYKRKKVSEIVDNQSLEFAKGRYNNKKYTEEYKFYGTRNNFLFDHYYTWHKYIKKESIIYEKTASAINEVINTEPQQLIIKGEICTIQKLIFHITNPDNEIDLLIRDIRSDIYQVQIFPYSSPILPDNKTDKYNVTRTISPKGTYAIELYVIIDYIKAILGTLYIEFNNKKVLLIPIKIKGSDNKYGLSPIYQIDAQLKKFLTIPIKIFNPSDKVLVIKKVVHPFKKINIVWPNGSSVITNANLPSSSMFQIQPNSSKNIIYLKYYSAMTSSEFGIIQIQVVDDAIIIPVLIKSILSPIITYPKIFNFGLCQIEANSKYNIRKIIPLNLINMGTENIKIGKVYLEYDNIFIQFHHNFNGNNVVIIPNEEIKYGYLIFEANLIPELEKKKRKLLGRLQKGSIYIETNSTECPFIQVNYSFLPDIGNIEKIISGDVQKLPKHQNKFSFEIKVKYNAPFGLEKLHQYKFGDNITLLYEKFVLIKTVNPKNDDQAYNVNIFFEIEKLDIFHFKRFFYVPLYLTFSLYSYIPIQLDNNDINIVYCGTKENSLSLSSCLRTFGTTNMFDNLKNESHKMINFRFSLGSTLFGIKKQRFLFLINENSSPLHIRQINCDNELITLGFENIEYLGNGNSPIYDKNKLAGLENVLLKNLKIKNKSSKEPTSIIIYPYSAIKFSINLNANIQDTISIKGKNTIVYNNNSKFIIDNTAQIYKGSFDIIQSSIKFEPAFPGLIQTIIIECQNTMEIPISIYSATCLDPRVVPSLLTHDILSDNKTKFLKIVFDPSTNSLLKQYLNGIDFQKILTYKELYLWKEREKYFYQKRAIGKTEMNADIVVETSMGKKIINVNSDIILPNIIKSGGITFGLVQVGKMISGYFEIYNPSDQVLAVKLVLVPNDYGDINNHNMLSSKEIELLTMNDDLILLGCNFIGKIENENSVIKKFEYIIIPERINLLELRKDLINKKELIKLIFKYGNTNVKYYLNHGYEVFCKYKKRNKDQLIINYSKLEVVSNLFSEHFEQEIEIVKNLTTKDYKQEDKKNEPKKPNILQRIYNFFVNLYIKYYLHVSINTEIKRPPAEQNFYLPSNIYNQIYVIQPHKKGQLGPIVFKPSKTGNITETLILKNNLTFIYPLRLLGVGGGAEPSFYPKSQKNTNANSHIFNKTNYIIEIDEETFNSELKVKGKITKTLTIKNTGNLDMDVKNITIDGYKCETDDLKILQCEEFKLSPKENIDIDIEIKPNMNNYITNKNIYFNTEYQVFNLNVIIIISKDVYIKNNLFKNKIIPIIFLLIVFSILFLLGKAIFKIINFYKTKFATKKEKILDKEEKEEINLENKNEIEKLEKIEEIDKDKKKEEEEENNNKNQSKNKKKKSKKKNKGKSGEINRSDNNQEKIDNIDKKEKEEKEEKEFKNEEIKKEEEKKEIEKKEEDNNNNYKEFKLYSSYPKKTSKGKPSIKEKEEEKEKINKTAEEKSNETDSLNDVKINTNTNINNTIKNEIYDKNKKATKSYNNYNYNYYKGNDRSNQRYSASRKNYYNTYNTYNTYNNYNNYNDYNNYDMTEEKKPGKTIKLVMNKKVNNLSDLFKEEPKKEKKIKKKVEKEKSTNENDNNKIRYYYPINNKDNTNNKINEMNPTFLKDEKSMKEFNIEQELLENKENKDNSKNESNCINSIFNWDMLLTNDYMNINSKENSENNEYIDEGENIKDLVNKSLIENIENPYPILDDDGNEKSRFFQYDFFKDKKDDN